ncbi:MAG: hypothetical protein JWQ03_589 [Variovorax sp.]|nr:hypothetical protein [Variovorax sp.]
MPTTSEQMATLIATNNQLLQLMNVSRASLDTVVSQCQAIRDSMPTGGGSGSSAVELKFVPLVRFGGASTGIAYAPGSQTGDSSKLGTRVDFTLDATLTSKGSATGPITIAGLPYPAGRTSVGVFIESATGITGQLVGLIPAGTTTIELYQVVNGVPTALTNTHATNTMRMTVSGVYFTAALAPGEPTTPGVDVMDMGLNLAWVTNWNGAWMFNNIMYNAGVWERWDGSAWVLSGVNEDSGNLIDATGIGVWRILVSDSNVQKSLPLGDYTILNPNGCKIQVSNSFADPGTRSQTSPQTYTHSNVNNAVLLYCTGPCTGVRIIMPGQLTAWQAGNIWSTDFLAFHAGLDVKILRTMDWTNGSGNVETDWTDRVRPDAQTLRHGAGGLQGIVPWEFIIDLANRIGADPWVCLPVRSTAGYEAAMAALFKDGTGAIASPVGLLGGTGLGSTHKVYLERGNEVWNTGPAWAGSANWVQFLNHTKTLITVNPATDVFTHVGHGFTTGKAVRIWWTPQTAKKCNGNEFDNANLESWLFCRGEPVYLEVIDTDHYKARSNSPAGPIITVTDTMSTFYVVNPTEAGKDSGQAHANYGVLSLRSWDTFDAALTAARVHRLVGSQAVYGAITTARLTAPVIARASSVTIAPYVNGDVYVTAVTIGTGSLAPKVWSSDDVTCYMALCPSASTPTDEQVIAGAGGGITAARSATAVPGNAGVYTNPAAGGAFTGLVNGTNYKVVFLFVDVYGLRWRIEQTVAPAVAVSTVYGYDTLANQQLRMIFNSSESSAQTVPMHMALASGLPVGAYEGASHQDYASPQQASDWIKQVWLPSAQYAEAHRRNLLKLAALGCRYYCVFTEMTGPNGTWNITTKYGNTTDPRYVMLATLGNAVPKRTNIDCSNVSVPNLPTKPGSFPYVMQTLPAGTYTIRGGNQAGNFDVSGTSLRMIADTGINWALPTTQTLILHATDTFTDDLFSVQIITGNSWYASDAIGALEMTTQAAPASLTSKVGSALTPAGAQGAFVGGMFNNQAGSEYGSVTALIAAGVYTKPLFVAMVFDKDDQTAAFTGLAQFGISSHFITAFVRDSAANFSWRFYVSAPAQDVLYDSVWAAGKSVRWLFVDPGNNKVYHGYNQTDVTGGTGLAAPDLTGVTLPPHAMLYATNDLKGSYQVVNRTGMTLADGLALVQKMMTLHGIA